MEYRLPGRLPNKRSYHASCVVGSHLLLYGGEDIKEGSYADMWSLNLSECLFEGCEPRWELRETSGASPGPLSHHKMVEHDGKAYVFGGIRSDENSPSLFSFEPEENRWYREPR